MYNRPRKRKYLTGNFENLLLLFKCAELMFVNRFYKKAELKSTLKVYLLNTKDYPLDFYNFIVGSAVSNFFIYSYSP